MEMIFLLHAFFYIILECFTFCKAKAWKQLLGHVNDIFINIKFANVLDFYSIKFIIILSDFLLLFAWGLLRNQKLLKVVASVSDNHFLIKFLVIKYHEKRKLKNVAKSNLNKGCTNFLIVSCDTLILTKTAAKWICCTQVQKDCCTQPFFLTKWRDT